VAADEGNTNAELRELRVAFSCQFQMSLTFCEAISMVIEAQLSS